MSLKHKVINWKCPECGSNELIESLTFTGYYHVTEVEYVKYLTENVYSNLITNDSPIVEDIVDEAGYQCICGYKPWNNAYYPEEVIEWLEDHGMIKEENKINKAEII
jgi:hypothetical protein